MKKYLSWKLLTILIVTLFLGFFDLPNSVQTKIIPFTPDWIEKTKINLGLDLQGGSQLDYKIDLRKVTESDKESIVEGVQEIIEKRVNGLGVSEPNIYRSEVAGETHIIVEIADTGVLTQSDVDQYLGNNRVLTDLSEDQKKQVSLEKAKATVGKTIQLEFKELKANPNEIDPEEKNRTEKQAKDSLEKIKKGTKFSIVGQEEQQAFPGKASYEEVDFTFESSLRPDLKDAIIKLKKGEVAPNLIETTGNFVLDATGQAVQDTGYAIVQLVDTKEEVKNEKEVDVSHILIAYKDAEGADASVTRNAEEANTLAKEVKTKLEEGGDFTALAKEYSSDTDTKDNGGKIEKTVNGDGGHPYEFEKAALAFEKEGEISEPVKTQKGYHIIKADTIRKDVKETQYKFEILNYSTKPDPWQETGLNGEHFVHADVQLDQYFQPFVNIQFDEEGAKLFEEITGRNVNKPVAMFVGGELISAPNVNEKIVGGIAQINGDFTNDEAQDLARNLNTGAIPAPIVLTGEYTLGSTLGAEALNQSLWAGFIGVLLVMLFMMLYYRLPGVVASAALIIYGVILLFLIKAQFNLGISLVISMGVFLFLTIKILGNKDSGWEKFLSFVLAFAGLIFFTYLLKGGVVLTLAGVAGLIISFGMAVDANVLIFERIKEELKAGKKLSSAIEIGFDRAWSAIRDSNFSALITCAILFYFGSSIIRGFAFNLAAGILVSMFTAITITKILLQAFIHTKLADNMKWFGVTQKKETTFDFIGKSKVWFSVSGITFIISILAIAIFGLKFGIDFKGGSLLEFKFQEPVTTERLAAELVTIEEEINAGKLETTTPETTESTTESEVVIEAPETTPVDLKSAQIITSGENQLIVKTKYLEPEVHTQLLAKMKEKFPEFQETRFTTIGPTIGKSLLQKAMVAGIVSIIMIVIYLYIAFRKIPKEVNPWRFGASAVATLIHDVVIILGIFAIVGQFANFEIDALFVTAMLTIFGYSVNDRIVIFDRLRETLNRNTVDNVKEVANKALNQTLARSINTSISIVLTMAAILIFGSPSIFYFVLTLTLGVLIAAYSSVFIAAPLIVYWSTRNK